MRKFLTIAFLIFISSSMIPKVAESIETEEQAVEIARTGLIHGSLSIQSLTEMIKYFEHAITISDGSTRLKEHADKAVIHARKALIELKEALRYAEQSSRITVGEKK